MEDFEKRKHSIWAIIDKTSNNDNCYIGYDMKEGSMESTEKMTYDEALEIQLILCRNSSERDSKMYDKKYSVESYIKDFEIAQIGNVFTVCFNTGAGDFSVDDINTAKNEADKLASYTQQSIIIKDDTDTDICMRKWYGVKPESDSGDIIPFGNYGYYDEWEWC